MELTIYMVERENEIKNDIIEGRNAVIEALRAGRAIDKIFIAKGDVDKTLGHIASKAREKGVVVVEADRRKLDFMSQTHAHQGVIALAGVREYCQISDILALAEQRQEPPFVIVCDEISDPQIWGPSSALPSAPVLTASSSPSAAAPGSPPLWTRLPPGRRSTR